MTLNKSNLTRDLSGGNLKSIGKANKVIRQVNTQKDFDELFSLLYHDDRIIVMRAADAIEKITLTYPQFLQPHKKEILALSHKAVNIELKWHLALLLSRFKLTNAETGKTWARLMQWATDKNESRIVRTHAIQALYEILQRNPELERDFTLVTDEIQSENIPSINARIRKIKSLMFKVD